MLSQPLGIEAGCNQFVVCPHVHAHMAGVENARGSDAKMHFFGAGIADQLDQLRGGRPAHQRVVDDDHALSRQVRGEHVEFHGHAPFAQNLRGFDEGASDVAVLDESVVERDARLPRVADGCGNRRVGHRNDHIRRDGRFDGQLLAQFLPHFVDAFAVPFAVRSRKIDKLERAARGPARSTGRALPGDFLAAHDDNLAILHFGDIAASQRVERAGFGSGGPAALGGASDGKRTEPPRIARCDETIDAEQHEGISTLPRRHGALESFLPSATAGRREHESHHFGVAGRGEGEAALQELRAQLSGIDQ